MTKQKDSPLKRGDIVVYRLTDWSVPKIGTLESRNEYPDWEPGCWVVRDMLDHRLYALESRKGSKVRHADGGDVSRYYTDRRDRAQRAEVQCTLFDDDAEVAVKVTAVPSNMGKQAAKEIESETGGEA